MQFKSARQRKAVMAKLQDNLRPVHLKKPLPSQYKVFSKKNIMKLKWWQKMAYTDEDGNSIRGILISMGGNVPRDNKAWFKVHIYSPARMFFKAQITEVDYNEGMKINTRTFYP